MGTDSENKVSLDDHRVKDGYVVGHVSTGFVGCGKDFKIVSTEEALTMTEEELDEAAMEALFNEIDFDY